MNGTKRLPGLLLLLAQSAVLYTLLACREISGGNAGGIWPFLLLPAAALIYGADLLFLRRERSVLALAGLNGLFSLLLTLAAVRSTGTTGVTRSIMLCLICVLPALQAARLSLKPPTLNSMILWTDLSAAGLVLLAAVLSIYEGRSLLSVLPAAAGLAAALCGLVTLRMNRLQRRGRLLLCLLLAVLLLLTVLLMAFAAEPAGQGLAAAWHGAGSLLKRLWLLIERGAEYLASLMPEDRYSEPISAAEVGLPGAASYEDSSGKTMGFLLFYLLTGAALAAAIAALVVFGRLLLKKRIGGGTGSTGISRGPSLREALLEWREARRRQRRIRLFLRENRCTAAGMLFRLEKLCAGSELARQPSETPAAFLYRLAQQDYGEAGQAFDFPLLISAVNRALFLPGAAEQPESIPFADALCTAVSDCVRRERTGKAP